MFDGELEEEGRGPVASVWQDDTFMGRRMQIGPSENDIEWEVWIRWRFR